MTATDIAIAIVEDRDRFLIGRRPAGVPLAGLWEFPGGKVKASESPVDAAVRECLEESGIEVEVIGQFPPHTQTYDYGTVRLNFYHCRPLLQTTPPRSPFIWVSRAELDSYEFPAGNAGVLKLLKEI